MISTPPVSVANLFDEITKSSGISGQTLIDNLRLFIEKLEEAEARRIVFDILNRTKSGGVTK